VYVSPFGLAGMSRFCNASLLWDSRLGTLLEPGLPWGAASYDALDAAYQTARDEKLAPPVRPPCLR
jgi:hypothetical protein